MGSEPLELNQRRIFILPTQRGLGFGLLIILLALIAFVYNNNLAYLLAFLLASIFFITILHTYYALAGLKIQEGPVINVFAGEAAGFGVIISNPGSSERQAIKVSMKASSELISLKARGSITLTLYDNTKRRGWHEPGTVTISSIYPLGLFRAWSPIRFSNKALVYPKPYSGEIPFPEAPSSNENSKGRFKKGGDDFYGLQSYQAGDSLKQLHWKAYAKGLGLFTKQYGGESAAEIWLDFSLAPGSSVEERLSALCRWVVDTEQAAISYGFIMPGLRLEAGTGTAHYRQCLEAMALY